MEKNNLWQIKKYLDDTGLAHVWSKIKEKLLPSNYTITSSSIKVESGTADTNILFSFPMITRIFTRSTKSLSYRLRFDDVNEGDLSFISVSGTAAWNNSLSDNKCDVFFLSLSNESALRYWVNVQAGSSLVGFVKADESGRVRIGKSGYIARDGQLQLRYCIIQSSIKSGTVTLNQSTRDKYITGFQANVPALVLIYVITNTTN